MVADVNIMISFIQSFLCNGLQHVLFYFISLLDFQKLMLSHRMKHEPK